MKETRIIMGMPVSLEVARQHAEQRYFELVFDYLRGIDERFSTYKSTSEISKINSGEITEKGYSDEMKEVLEFSERTKKETRGYFDIMKPDGSLDPSGLVKGLAIQRAAELLKKNGVEDFCLEVAGDIQCSGKNSKGLDWSVGIRNPFKREEIIKVLYPRGRGVATSGTYIRGEHIYDPVLKKPVRTPFVSLTVIGPDIYEADRFATAAFAMGERAVEFIQGLEGFEAYAVDGLGRAVETSRFEDYTHA